MPDHRGANGPLEAGEKQGQKGHCSGRRGSTDQLFEHGKTFGSLIRVSENLAEKLPGIAERVQEVLTYGDMLEQPAARSFKLVVEQA